jgi:hypothetical protein
MSVGIIIFHRDLNSELPLSVHDGFVGRGVNRALKVGALSWEEFKGSTEGIGYPRKFAAVNEDSPVSLIVQPRNGPEVFHGSSENHPVGLWRWILAVPPVPARVFVQVHGADLVNPDVRSVLKIVDSFGVYIGFAHRRQLALENKSVGDQGNQSNEGNPTADGRNNIKPFGIIKLFAAISPLIGIPLFFVGFRLNSYGINHVRFASTMGGWCLMVLGTMLVIGPVAVFLAHLLLRVTLS